jgi:hypothetical protein
MKTIPVLLLLGAVGLPGLAGAQDAAAPVGGRHAGTAAQAGEKPGALDSRQMEKDLQRLPWPRFRAIVEAVPKLRAGVEAYGPAGWQIVQANYTRYHWQKNIDKLDEAQRKQLAELIRAAKTAR